MKVYFCGSIRAGRDNQKFCKEVIDRTSKYGVVLTEHVGNSNMDDEGEKHFTEEYIYKRDMAWLKEADAVVAEVTTPSLGVGYELAYAEVWGKPILCLYNTAMNASKLSAMIMGAAEVNNPQVKISYYNEISEIKGLVDDYFASLDKKSLK